MGRANQILVAGAGIVVAVVVAITATMMMRQSDKLRCAEQLKSMSVICGDFADSRPGEFADWLNGQIRQGTVLVNQVTCPVGGRRYECRSDLIDTSDPQTVLCFEPVSNHGDGANVLYADGHATFVNAAKLSALLRRGPNDVSNEN